MDFAGRSAKIEPIIRAAALIFNAAKLWTRRVAEAMARKRRYR
jgi:hypothetical protein